MADIKHVYNDTHYVSDNVTVQWIVYRFENDDNSIDEKPCFKIEKKKLVYNKDLKLRVEQKTYVIISKKDIVPLVEALNSANSEFSK